MKPLSIRVLLLWTMDSICSTYSGVGLMPAILVITDEGDVDFSVQKWLCCGDTEWDCLVLVELRVRKQAGSGFQLGRGT